MATGSPRSPWFCPVVALAFLLVVVAGGTIWALAAS